MLQEELTKRKAAEEFTIKPAPKVKGDVWPEKHMNLSWLDIKNAFTTCQNGFTGRDTAETAEGSETIDLEEFITLLGLCGHIKYAEIEEMMLADKFVAMVDNWCMLRDEQAVIEDACVPPPPRFDFAKLSKPLKGQEPKEYERLIATWRAMDLSHIYGFPVWEEAAFGIIQRSFGELVSIFTEYAKSGTAGSSSAKAAMTMQSTELTNLALDCELATEDFPTSRINLIFMRADQVDDTLVVDRTNRQNVQGKGAERGDNGLELHELLECLIFLAFSRENPDFGNRGKEVDPDDPMPGCLETVLQKNILKKARRDRLAKVRKIIEKDPEVAVVKKKRYAALRDQFELTCMGRDDHARHQGQLWQRRRGRRAKGRRQHIRQRGRGVGHGLDSRYGRLLRRDVRAHRLRGHQGDADAQHHRPLPAVGALQPLVGRGQGRLQRARWGRRSPTRRSTLTSSSPASRCAARSSTRSSRASATRAGRRT